MLGQYGMKNKAAGGKTASELLSKNEVLTIELAPILSHISTKLEQIPLRELAIMLQGIALVYF